MWLLNKKRRPSPGTSVRSKFGSIEAAVESSQAAGSGTGNTRPGLERAGSRMGVLLLRKQSSGISEGENNVNRRAALERTITSETVTSPKQLASYTPSVSSGRFLSNHGQHWGHEQEVFEHFKPYYLSSDSFSARDMHVNPLERPQSSKGVARLSPYELLPTGEENEATGPSEACIDTTSARWRCCSHEIVESTAFQSCVAVMILFNAVVIGCETDLPDKEWLWDRIESTLLCLFTTELALRVSLLPNFFAPRGADFSWNIFDTFLVTAGLVDFVLSSLFASSTSGGVSELAHRSSGVMTNGGIITTVFRIFRTVRILRLIRLVKFLKQLYILSYGLFMAAEAIFWVSILIIVVLYTCAIVLVRTVGHPSEEEPTRQANNDFWEDHYGTVGNTMLTLFQLMVQPNFWQYREMLFEYPLFTLFLFTFIIFGSFGMIALLTGVITEAMFRKNQVRLEEEHSDRELVRSALLETCKLLFDEVCAGSDEISRAHVRVMLPRIGALLDEMDVRYTVHELEDMVELMDTDGSGFVNKSEFCRCLLHIAENSEDLRPMLMMELHHDSMSFLKSRLADFKVTLDAASAEQRASRDFVHDCMTQLLQHLETAKTTADERQASWDARMAAVESEVQEVRSAMYTLTDVIRSAEGRRRVESSPLR